MPIGPFDRILGRSPGTIFVSINFFTLTSSSCRYHTRLVSSSTVPLNLYFIFFQHTPVAASRCTGGHPLLWRSRGPIPISNFSNSNFLWGPCNTPPFAQVRAPAAPPSTFYQLTPAGPSPLSRSSNSQVPSSISNSGGIFHLCPGPILNSNSQSRRDLSLCPGPIPILNPGGILASVPVQFQSNSNFQIRRDLSLCPGAKFREGGRGRSPG